jgi:formylglycine-generating enzyme required for sulfatase activity
MLLQPRYTLPLALIFLAGCAVEIHRTSPPVAAAAAAAPVLTPACPSEMARVEGFCVDKWEAHVVELDAAERERPHSPYDVIAGKRVRAKSAPGVVPQGYVSQLEAREACEAAGKRLCAQTEFVRACRGPGDANFYPYGGRQHERGVCNEGKFSGVTVMFGRNPSIWTYENFNDPRLNQLAGGLAPTGAFDRCVTPEGAYDMVGNLHEWVESSRDKHDHVRFRGGSYGDAEKNGPGCLYVTSAHEPEYHDYSTGFRCCRDADH